MLTMSDAYINLNLNPIAAAIEAPNLKISSHGTSLKQPKELGKKCGNNFISTFAVTKVIYNRYDSKNFCLNIFLFLVVYQQCNDALYK